MLAQPKPVKYATVKGRKQRQARAVVQSVRVQCVERDGYCRIGAGLWMDTIAQWHWAECGGVSEWAHMGDKKRFKTRGQAPEVRHTTAGSLMLCQFHHRAYDRGDLEIIGSDANRPMLFRWKRIPHVSGNRYRSVK